MKSNIVIRLTKILMKATITAANHEAQSHDMVSNYTRKSFGYLGLLNSGFSYSPLLTQDGDTEIDKFDTLGTEEISWITDGQDFDIEIVKHCYNAALSVYSAMTVYINNDFLKKSSEEVAVEPINEIPASEPAPKEELVADKNISEVVGVPEFIAKGLATNSIIHTRQVVAIGYDNFEVYVKKIKGASLQKNKFNDWFNAIVKA